MEDLLNEINLTMIKSMASYAIIEQGDHSLINGPTLKVALGVILNLHLLNVRKKNKGWNGLTIFD